MSTTTADSNIMAPAPGVGYLAWARTIRRLNLHRSTKAVAQALGLHTTRDTGRDAHPGRERLAQETGMSKRSITTHLGILERLGLVVCVARGSDMGRSARASEYALAVPEWVAERVKATPKGRLVDLSNPPEEEVRTGARTGAISAPVPVQEQVQNGARNRCSQLPPTSTYTSTPVYSPSVEEFALANSSVPETSPSQRKSPARAQKRGADPDQSSNGEVMDEQPEPEFLTQLRERRRKAQEAQEAERQRKEQHYQRQLDAIKDRQGHAHETDTWAAWDDDDAEPISPDDEERLDPDQEQDHDDEVHDESDGWAVIDQA